MQMKVICSSKIDSYVAHVFLHNKPIDFPYFSPFLLDMRKIMKFIEGKLVSKKHLGTKSHFCNSKSPKQVLGTMILCTNFIVNFSQILSSVRTFSFSTINGS